ncbi:MAG: hypothetical protein M3R35_01475 [Candidatus Eremiobacteraeota bacterium]|nr:hypothetical protein [Candidatus Eremiobacteraeota bacterium]
MERAPERQIGTYPHWPLAKWQPDLPAGKIERIYTHWSAHDYGSVFPAYHFCVAIDGAGDLVVVNTHDVRENMRNVYEEPESPYAQHTRGRNSHALGISIMGMQGARPDDFGEFPLTEPLIDGLCLVGARLAKFYGVTIDADHVMSHAEAALRDGYFGTEPEQRWDIARLRSDSRPLEPREGTQTGDELRGRMRRFLATL